MVQTDIRLIEAGPFLETEWKGNVIIFPGGGYEWHSPREAEPVANAFGAAGWKPWILYYPVKEPGSQYSCLGLDPLRCGAGAVKRVRASMPEKPVIVCGFSAGGHAAASLGVHWNDDTVFQKEEQKLIRPDGMVLCYPVITCGPWAHRGSIENLAGENKDLIAYFSLEDHVDPKTPPAFLWHTASDESVPVQNSLMFAQKLSKEKVPFELHIYPKGPHGLSLATKEVDEPAKGRLADAHVAGWFDQCLQWLENI